MLKTMIVSASDFGSGLMGTALGLGTFLLLATGAFVEIQDSLNLIWKAQPAGAGFLSLLHTRLLSLALVVGIGFLLLVSLAKVDLGDHHKKVLWRTAVVSLVMLAVGVLTGAIGIG